MRFKSRKVKESCCVCVCGIRYNRISLHFFYVLFISIITIDTSFCTSNEISKTKSYDALNLYDNFTKVPQTGQKEDTLFESYLDRHSLEMDAMNTSTIDEESQEHLYSLSGKTLRKVSSSLSRSSQLGNLIELLSQHSAEVLKNNNSGSNDMTNKHATILHSLDTFDPMKEDNNISDSYFDILYDLDLEIHHNDHAQTNNLTSDNTTRGSLSHGHKGSENHGHNGKKR